MDWLDIVVLVALATWLVVPYLLQVVLAFHGLEHLLQTVSVAVQFEHF